MNRTPRKQVEKQKFKEIFDQELFYKSFEDFKPNEYAKLLNVHIYTIQNWFNTFKNENDKEYLSKMKEYHQNEFKKYTQLLKKCEIKKHQ